MKPRKKKEEFSFTYVAVGLVVGFFIGASLVYLFSGRQNGGFPANDLWVYLQNVVQGADTAPSEQEVESGQKVTANQTTTEHENRPGITRLVLPDLPGDTVEDNPAMQNQDLQSESLGNEAGGMAEMDQTGVIRTSEDQNIRRMQFSQDRLLHIRAYNIGDQHPGKIQSEAQWQLDSLVGNYPKADASRQVLIVEFWQSPLNLMGYKMTRSKLILYGLDQLDAFSLHTDGDSFILKYADNFYLVGLTNTFTPLRSIEYPELLEEFHQRWP